jgi:DNA-binding transcriptional ArsR family regulator
VQAVSDSLFKALADPTRRTLFERLVREGEQTVHALTAQAGVSQPMVSKHLAVLKTADLVADRRQGRETHYSALPDSLMPLIEWAARAQATATSRHNCRTALP